MNMRTEWKTAIQAFLDAPLPKTPAKPKLVEPHFYAPALLSFIKMCIYSIGVTVQESIPVLKRKLLKAIKKETEVSFNLRLDAIEKNSRVPIPKIEVPLNHTFKKPLVTSNSTLQKKLKTHAQALFKYKKKSDLIKSNLLYHMQVIYFAADQDEIKKVVASNKPQVKPF
jgi:hypothetical protein